MNFNQNRMRVGGFSIAQLVAGVFTTAALTVVLLSTAGAKSNAGAAKVMDGAEHYGCGDICFSRYNTCLNQGKSIEYCGNQYNLCLMNCGGTTNRVAD